MATITQSISSLGSIPTTADPSTFDARADAFLGTALPTLRTEINTWAGQANTVAGEVSANAVSAAADAVTASADADAAAAASTAANAASNATLWVSGTLYSVGNVVYSPITFFSYRRKTIGSGATDPSLDETNWALISGDVTTNTIQTLTNKTLSGAFLSNGYTEEVFAVTGTTPALSPTNGSIQTWTLSNNSTPTAGTWDAGQSITLMIDDGSIRSINWNSLAVTWKTDGGSAPTLNTTGFTVIQLWKVGATIYGARVGDA